MNKCIYCSKSFSTKQNTILHMNKCNCKDLYEENKKLKQEIERLETKIQELELNAVNKTKNTTKQINNTQNNNIIINTSQSLKDIISNLQPINFEEMKTVFENNFSNKYIDKGIEGLAQFICEVPCQNKFVTTDYSRKVITYKTSDQQIISDPKANILLNTAIKQNADTIIDKAEHRYKYWKSQVDESREEDVEPDETDLENKLHTKKLKTIAQRVKENIPVDSTDATNLIVLKGIVNKNVVNSIE